MALLPQDQRQQSMLLIVIVSIAAAALYYVYVFRQGGDELIELTEQTDEHPEGIISAIPRDPWGGDYEYVSGTEHGFDLICYGRDGTEGGEGEDKDIISYEMDQSEEGEGSSDNSGG